MSSNPFPQNQVLKGLALVNGAVILMGLTGIFGKLVSSDPFTISGVRALLSFASMFCVFYFYRRRFPSFPWIYKWPMMASGLLLAIHWWTFFTSIQQGGVAIGVFTFSTFPIFVTLAESWLSGRRPQIGSLVSCVVSLSGIGLVMGELPRDISLGATIYGMISAVTFALFTLLNKQLIAKVSAPLMTLWQNAIAALVLSPFFVSKLTLITKMDWLWLFLLGVVVSNGVQVLFNQSMKHLSAKLSSLVVTLEAPYGVLFAMWILDEQPSSATWFGGLLILSAVVYESRKEQPVQ